MSVQSFRAEAHCSEPPIELVHLVASDASTPVTEKTLSSSLDDCKYQHEEIEVAKTTCFARQHSGETPCDPVPTVDRTNSTAEITLSTSNDEKTNVPGPTDLPHETGEEDIRNADGERVIRDGRDVSDYLISDRDDGDACFTLRSVTLALVGSAFQAVLTQIYRFKPTEVDINGTFLAIIIYLLGTAWARLLPTRGSLIARFGQDRLPRWLLTTVHIVNPGPFGLKEHAIASITASSASSGAHSSDVFGTQKLFYPKSTSPTRRQSCLCSRSDCWGTVWQDSQGRSSCIHPRWCIGARCRW